MQNVVIYGGEGAIGSAVARAFAAQGARVVVVGRRACDVDVLDYEAVAAHAATLGPIDVVVNAVAFPYAQGRLADLSVAQVLEPIERFVRANLHIAKAVAPRMTGGALLTFSTAGARFARPGNLGFGTACAAIEQLTQRLAAELAPTRVVCLRPTALADPSSYTREVFAPLAAADGLTVDELLARWGSDLTLLGRLPTAEQVADAAVSLAGSPAITGAVIDLTCGNAIRARQYGGALIGMLD
jgi:NAD(P)-dependent dehydrogenase (short-subunit alcohol dehydrogenase family)